MLYIAENLKSLRKKKEMTQEEAAEMLGVSPQSVSKWERGDTLPDITLLPALANLYKVSVDALIGMDKINAEQTRTAVFIKGQALMRCGAVGEAAEIYAHALKTLPNDEGLLAELAFALALGSDMEKLEQAVSLCERALSGNPGEKLRHTTRAALCFIYLKAGQKERAVAAAKSLPHIRESREAMLAQFEKEPSADDINAYLRFIALGEGDEQDVVAIDFGKNMLPVCTEHDLAGRVEALRKEIDAPHNKAGYQKLPRVRIRDNCELSPNRVRVRCYADYLLDEEFFDHNGAVNKIILTLRKIAQA